MSSPAISSDARRAREVLSPACAQSLLCEGGALHIGGVPEGADALLLAALAGDCGGLLTHVTRDEARMSALAEQLRFFAPGLEVLCFPAWDCLPYDRVSPRADVMMRRLECLYRLQEGRETGESPPRILLTTVNAIVQRVVARTLVSRCGRRLRQGDEAGMEELTRFCIRNGYTRVDVVSEPGEFARRGGLLDIWPVGVREPLRLDFFGDTLESLRGFDASSQRSAGREEEFLLLPASEAVLDEIGVRRFRRGYVARFGVAADDDSLYQAISRGERFRGMEHWLPLFHEKLECLFDYLPPDGWLSFDPLCENARRRRLQVIEEYQQERARHVGERVFGAPVYQPLPAEELYLPDAEWQQRLEGMRLRLFAPGSVGDADDAGIAAAAAAGTEVAAGTDIGMRRGRDFARQRAQAGSNVFEALAQHINRLRAQGVRVVAASWSALSRERLCALLGDHGVADIVMADSWQEVLRLPPSSLAGVCLALESGVEGIGREGFAGICPPNGFAIISEQDVLGERLIWNREKRRKRKRIFIDIGDLAEGDYVVHADHGIARFDGLRTLETAGAWHDCLLLTYKGGDSLFLPVENADLLSRYASDGSAVSLDRLGGSGWQARKAGLRKRLRDMAGRLIATAKARALTAGAVLETPPGYEEFCARFPFEETEDQAQAMEKVAKDMGSGRPMDRLICGDVGFGKTEVALRAAFFAVMNGWQVAVLAPTTLLARQHFATFQQRFFGFPVELRQLSRFVSSAEARETVRGLAAGKVDIVVGTHALLGKRVDFHSLGLFVLDEEQHFGVRHKERLKELQHGVHVLTLSATPIPRTLQLALSGARELSIIATPPVDRIAVRSYLSPFDAVVTREALLRERYRGGRSFYVCPRISDLDDVAYFLRTHVPELKVIMAHGKMPVARLDAAMTAFYEGACDVLLSTNIVESGLDVPEANTLIVHRSELFGLAQLYQLRGRIGRGKRRAYAYFTVPANRILPPGVERRLHALLSMEELGGGLRLAFHDLDMRGAGNLLGEEQSGHIREVGFELYRSMLEEALQESRGEVVEEAWSPRISVAHGEGRSALIPERFVAAAGLRMSLYRRLGRLREVAEVEEFGEELQDRFGALPPEVLRLLGVVRVKILCRRAGVERMEAGSGGVVVKFRRDWFADPASLARWIEAQAGAAWLRPDHHLVWRAAMDENGQDGAEDARLQTCLQMAEFLAGLVAATQQGEKAAKETAPAA